MRTDVHNASISPAHTRHAAQRSDCSRTRCTISIRRSNQAWRGHERARQVADGLNSSAEATRAPTTHTTIGFGLLSKGQWLAPRGCFQAQRTEECAGLQAVLTAPASFGPFVVVERPYTTSHRQNRPEIGEAGRNDQRTPRNHDFSSRLGGPQYITSVRYHLYGTDSKSAPRG